MTVLGQPSVESGFMEGDLASRYVATIGRLERQGFTCFDVDGLVLLHRRDESATGGKDTMVGVGYEPGTTSAALFEEQDKRVRGWYVDNVLAVRRRTGGVELFSILFAESADASAVEAARGPCPKRKGILSTRALVHGPNGDTEFFECNRMWGFAIIKRLRQDLLGFLGE